MWACRWFQRRPRAVLSQLHPGRRHAIAAKGATAEARAGRDPPGRRNRQKKHLYLVLDDAKDGAGIHKLDMDDDARRRRSVPLPQRLPEPPLVRIDYSMMNNFSVLGRHVIGTGRNSLSYNDDSRGDGDTVTFDTKTSALAVLPDLPIGICNGAVIDAVAVGNMLYVIENGSEVDFIDDDDEYCVGGLHRLRLEEEDGKPIRSDNKDEWGWYTSPDDYFPSPTRWRWSAHHRALPLSPYGVIANALHPRGRAFFVSVHCNFTRGHRGRGTFSYDTDRGRWARHGDWELPFVGQAHYDGGLRAWVGLHGGEGYLPDGYLCSCDVPHLGRRHAAEPAWKLGEERLFLEDPERHVDAKLVHMGGRGGRFCLVEILTREGVSWKERLGDGDRCVLRLTTFRVEYGDDGKLTTTARRPARSYKMSSHHDRFHWQAFWA